MAGGVQNIGWDALSAARALALQGATRICSKIVCRDIEGKHEYRVGDRIVRVRCGSTYTTFLFEYLKNRLGQEWIDDRATSRQGNRHPILRSMRVAHSYHRFVHAHVPKSTTHFVHCGAQRELSTLANDLATLESFNSLPDELIRRLKDPNGYQGARYEIAVAGSLVRHGFRLEWLPTCQSTPEFIAIDPDTKDQFVVEAKSRHRDKQVQFVSRATAQSVEAINADVASLYLKATRKQDVKLPLAVFIDANVPHRVGDSRPLLNIEGLASHLEALREPTQADPSEEFFLCVSTSGWYYALGLPAHPVRKTMFFPQWTTRCPCKVSTYVRLISSVDSMYTIPEAGDFSVALSSEEANRIAFPSLRERVSDLS